MPPQTVSFRPQTSRQARRAYQKAGGAPRLSEVELRRLERSAELQDRAARIKAHNDRARENKRKKAEKLEARKRMGLAEPAKIKIGPSQLSLGAFVGAGIMRKREEMLSSDSVKDKETTEPARSATEHPGSLPTQSPTGTPVASRSDLGSRAEKDAYPTAASLMPPPPRPPLSEASENTKAHPVFQSDRCDLSGSIGTDWETLFDSNTQVEREISAQKPSASGVHLRFTASTPINPHPNIDSDLLSNISTQDLQYSSSPPPVREIIRHGDTDPTYDSNEVITEEHMCSIDAESPTLHKSKNLTAPLNKQMPASSPPYDRLDIIKSALWERYCVHLPHTDIQLLLAGQHLNERSLLCAMVPPQLVKTMALKIEDIQRTGERPWTPIEIMQWATTRLEDEREEKENIAARLELEQEAIAHKEDARADSTEGRHLHETPLTKTTVSKREEGQESKSFDEFDVFDVSSQDLRDLDV
ncbi:MAG: hypothetical protein LQ348_002476 [Seirophora lacunosa]|nr:MAG: hypothetical protein LQ348_002476 [Seirophora lacunosa]